MLRKILILVILVLGIGINGYAKRFNADINAVTATENAQWDSSLRSFSWTANEAYIDIPVTLTLNSGNEIIKIEDMLKEIERYWDSKIY